MDQDKFYTLRTKPWDENFHHSRIMFCIIDDEVKVGPINTTKSHLEWFKEEGWLTEEDAEQFLNRNVRGFYLQSQDGLYCYRGIGFWFDDEVISEMRKNLSRLKKALNLNDDTKIFFGPGDSPLDGIEYPRQYEGTLKEILQK